MRSPTRPRTALSPLVLVVLLAGCSPPPPESLLAKAGTAMFQQRWVEAFKLCDGAFQAADKAGNSAAAIAAAECAAHAAAESGKPADALPHYARLFAAHDATLPVLARMRLVANHGVTLIEAGKREAGIAQLRQALDKDLPSSAEGGRWSPDTARAILVKNLARAYYDRASEPAVRAWVQEQADWFMEFSERHARASGGGIGFAAAFEAVSAVGRRQANTATPEWDAVIRQWEANEQAVIGHSYDKGKVCESIAYSEYSIYFCLRELKAPA